MTGVVTTQGISPEVDPETGETFAMLDLKLDPDVEPLPEDSTMIVRARSALGLKYLELVPGDSSEGFAAGSVVPREAARPEPVDIDDFLETFDEPTQVAIQANLVEFGNAVAGRGPDLNAALGELPATLRYLEPVAENLSAPETRFDRFIAGISAAAAEVAPVAEQQAEMFVNLDTTFTALARVAPSIQETIVETPPTFAAATEGEERGRSMQFFSTVPGAECSGPVFNLDNSALWVSVQHPGEGGTLEAPVSLWPDGEVAPRPSVVLITPADPSMRVGRVHPSV